MNALHVVGYIFFVLIFILFILFFYLLFRKVQEKRTRWQIERYKERTRLTMLKYLYEGESSRLLFPDHAVKVTALEELLNTFSHDAEKADAQERIQQFAERFFSGEYRRLLSHRRWSIRMNTLYLIEEFRIKILLPDVLKLYQRRDISRAEEGQILKMFAIFDDPHLFHLLKNSKYELSELTYRVIYGSMSNGMFQRFADDFQELSTVLRLTLIDMIGIQKRLEYGPFLEDLLTYEDLEVRIRSLKSIAQMGYVLPTEKLLKHLHAESWPERIMSIKICGSLHVESSLPYLIELMKDRVFQVRSQSAQAIAKFSNGAEVLRHIIDTTEDAFARDMALEWLERGMGQ